MKMLNRFALYGFLKELKFFEPFIILFFLEKGVSFFEIGILYGFKAVCVNIFEIPSGAAADIYGRKSSMTLSLSAYIVSFVIFALSSNLALLFCAMLFFSIGEAFRTGTHKALIFDYLTRNNIKDQKTKVYGFTRSWSKIGGAISALLSAGIVFTSQSYEWIFLVSIIPYLIGIWNIACYPSYLNHRQDTAFNIKANIRFLRDTFVKSFKNSNIRTLLLKGFVFNSQFTSTKDYLQVVVKAQVIAIPLFIMLEREQRVSLLIGIVYFVLYMLSSIASKNSYRLTGLFKNEDKALGILLLFVCVLYLISGITNYFNIYVFSIISFIMLFIIQNIWRPILVSKFDDYTTKDNQATVLSIESQTKALGTALFAPIAGFMADFVGVYSIFLLSSFIIFIYIIFSGTFKDIFKRD